MARDIEEFLRRAAERRAKQKKNKQQPASPPPQARKPAPPREQPKRRLVIGDDQVEVVKPRLVKNLREESVSEHVQRHISTADVSQGATSIGEHAEHLADKIQQTDERLEARLHKKFDHRLGRLDKAVSAEVEEAPQVTTDEVSRISNNLIKMLTSPASVRQAVLVSEVLKRPNFDDDE